MKRIIYGIGCFLVLLFLGAGILFSYEINVLRDRMSQIEEFEEQADEKVSALAGNRDQDFVFERYEDETLVREHYKITAYGADRVVLRQEPQKTEEKTEGDGFLIKVKEDRLVVYENGTDKVFEYTDIPLEALPSQVQAEVLLGKQVESFEELYSFLENYSS